MRVATDCNFAARVLARLDDESVLIDAATDEVVDAARIRVAVADFASWFASAGLDPGMRVLIGCSVSPGCALAYLGALFGGLVAVPVNESALDTMGEALSRKVGARALWTERAKSREWASRDGIVQLHGRPHPSSAGGAGSAFRGEHDLATLMATSGSTATPRLVKVTHANLIANTEAIIRSQRLGVNERAMLILPLSYCFGASVLHTHLYAGGGVVFDSRFMFPDKVLHAIGWHGCTTFAGVPTAYNILLRRSNLRSIPMPSLRRFLQAGGGLSDDRIREVRTIVRHAEFFVMYGQTEATARISCLPSARLDEKPGSVGPPLDNLTVRIVDSSGADLPPRLSGEIWVAGASVCPGYLDEPEETALKFRDGWLLTGDIGWRDEDGYLWITGRKSEFIKMRGVRVSLAEIEARVAALPGVADCAALAVPHVEAGEALALYVVPAASTGDLVTSIRRGVPSEWICESVTLIAELPRNLNGKLMRARLTEAARVGADGACMPSDARYAPSMSDTT